MINRWAVWLSQINLMRDSAAPPPAHDAAAIGRGLRQQIQAKRPLRRVEVLKEIVEFRDLGERSTNLLDAAKRGFRFSFAVLDDAIDHAGEAFDEFCPSRVASKNGPLTL